MTFALSEDVSRLMIDPQQNVVLDYWDDVRGANLLPRLSDFRMEEIAALVPRLSITQWEPPDRNFFRMIGGQLVSEGFEDPTGTNLFDYLSPVAREWLKEGLRIQLETPCLSLVEHRAFYDDGSYVDYIVTSLPLLDVDGTTGPMMSLDLPLQDDYPAIIKGVDAIGYEYGAGWFIDIGAGCPPPFIRKGWPPEHWTG